MTSAATLETTSDIQPVDGPYRGLAPFDATDDDAFLFFGREREREIIVANLIASRLTVLYGASGVGKTSLLRAGVAHRLREDPEVAVAIVGAWGGDPTRTVIDAVSDAVGSQPSGTLADQLDAWSLQLAGDVYLILDQLEEYFLYHGTSESPDGLIDCVPAIVNRRDLRVHVLLSIREDALAQLDSLKSRIPNLFGNVLRLDHLTRDAARAAVEHPLERYRSREGEGPTEIGPELVETVLDEVTAGRVDVGEGGRGRPKASPDKGRIEAPYLQLVMQRLWEAERDAGSPTLRLETLRTLGGAERIVEGHLHQAVDALTPAQRDFAAVIFEYLVTPSGTKIAHGLADLATYAGTSKAQLLPVLETLCGERLLRVSAPSTADSEPRYAIFHDVLASPMLAWRTSYRAERDVELERAAARRRQRRLVVLAGAALVAVAAMVAVTVFALTQRSEARAQARLAQSRALAASALVQVQSDPELAVLLAYRATRTAPTPQAEDALRQSLTASRVRAVLRNGGAVVDVAVSRDGKIALAGDANGTARLFDLRRGKTLYVFRHDGPVATVGFSPDSRRALTASEDGTARVWSVVDGTELATYRQDGPLAGAAFTADGLRVLTWGRDGTARLWAAGGAATVFRGDGPILDARLSPDGATVVAASEDATARLFDATTGSPLHVLQHEKPVTGAAFSPEGDLLVTWGKERVARLWRTDSGKLVHELSEHRGVVTYAEFSPDGTLVVTASADGAARTWDVASGVRTAIFLGHANAVTHVAFSPDGRFVVTSSTDRSARVWEASTGRPEVALLGHVDAVTDAVFTPDGEQVVTGSIDRTARVWDATTEPTLEPLASMGSPAKALYASGGRLVLTIPNAGAVRLLSATTGAPVRSFRHPGAIDAAESESVDGSVLATLSATEVRIWNPRTGALLRKFLVDTPATALAIDEAVTRLALAGADGVVRVLDATTGEETGHMETGAASATDVAFSPDGSLLASGAVNWTARIWNVRSGLLLHELKQHHEAVTSVAFDPEAARLVTGSVDGDARIWDVATGKPTVLLRGHFGTVSQASFSPDGRWIVTAGPVTAGLWDSANGHLLFFLRGHNALLTSAVFDPTGRWILTASRGGSVRQYRCHICGSVDALERLARQRLEQTGRALTAAESKQFLSDE
jgi:WD40 repeat protein